MDYSRMSAVDQQEARGTLADLRAAGVRTSLSQVAKAEGSGELGRWRRDALSTLELCARQGWDASGVPPLYRCHPERGLMVHLSPDAYRQAVAEARARDRAGEKVTAGWWVKRKDGTTQLRHLPQVRVRTRGGQWREQVILQCLPSAAHPDTVAWGVIPANRPQDPKRGVPCAVCDVWGACYLRRDCTDTPGLVCEACRDSDWGSVAFPAP